MRKSISSFKEKSDRHLLAYLLSRANLEKKYLSRYWGIEDLNAEPSKENYCVEASKRSYRQQVTAIMRLLQGQLHIEKNGKRTPSRTIIMGNVGGELARMIVANSIQRAMRNPRRFLFHSARFVDISTAEDLSPVLSDLDSPTVIVGYTADTSGWSPLSNYKRDYLRSFLFKCRAPVVVAMDFYIEEFWHIAMDSPAGEGLVSGLYADFDFALLLFHREKKLKSRSLKELEAQGLLANSNHPDDSDEMKEAISMSGILDGKDEL